MPIAVTPKAPVRASPFATTEASSSWFATVYPQAAQPSATCPRKGPRATRGQMSWSAGAQCKLAAVATLPGPEACRSPGPAGARDAPRHLLRCAFLGLPRKLLLPGSCANVIILSLVRPSRQAPLAGVLSLNLDTLFLNGFIGTRAGLGKRVVSPAAGSCYCPCTSWGTRVPLP